MGYTRDDVVKRYEQAMAECRDARDKFIATFPELIDHPPASRAWPSWTNERQQQYVNSAERLAVVRLNLIAISWHRVLNAIDNGVDPTIAVILR